MKSAPPETLASTSAISRIPTRNTLYAHQQNESDFVATSDGRHVCGGHVDVFSRAKTRHSVWHFVTRLNERHPTFAWLSLFSVGLTDLYIRLVAMGIIRDLRIL